MINKLLCIVPTMVLLSQPLFAPAQIPVDIPKVMDCEIVSIETEQEVEVEPIVNLGEFKLTAYCACYKCCGKNPTDKGYGITASGVKAVQGVTVAADTSVLPFGTTIYIDGIGERIVQDRGGAIKNKKIDVYFENHQEALSFGVQYRNVSYKENK